MPNDSSTPSMELRWLEDLEGNFPPVDEALEEPNGLLCAGGDLSAQTLLDAYSQGIFPWYEDDQPILWWSPDPRMIIEIAEFKPSRSVRKSMRKSGFRFSLDTCFREVILACAAPRRDDAGTWITQEMQEAYCALHEAGYAHSVEVWSDGLLVGGLYGVAIGKQFFGESMFSTTSNASKAALTQFVSQLHRWGFSLIDCQVANPHLASLGAKEIPRSDFTRRLAGAADSGADAAVAALNAPSPDQWQFDSDLAGYESTPVMWHDNAQGDRCDE